MLKFITGLNPARVACAIFFAVLLVCVALMVISGALHRGKHAEVTAKLEANRADAAIASASDAVNSIASSAANEAAEDAITRENTDAIKSAPGAHAPVDPAVHDAGLRGLCRRAAYRGSQQCMQFTPAR